MRPSHWNVLAVGLVSSACSVLPEISDEGARRVRGPLGTRMPEPLLMNFPQLGLRRGVVQPKGQLGLASVMSYSSIYEAGSSGADAVTMDGELAQATLRARYGLGGGFELETQAGLLHGGGGSLDRFVSEWHAFFGLPNGGRGDVDDDRFAMNVINDGVEGYALQPNELGWQDLALTLAWGSDAPNSEGRASLVRATVELPTGSDAEGFGNGEVDFGLGWNGEFALGRSTMFASASWVHAARSTSLRRAGIDLEERFCIGGAWELRLTESTSAVVQLEWLSPLTQTISLEEIDASYADFVVGLSRDLGHDLRASVGFQEDLLAAAGTDFSLIFGLGWRM
jgi:hypothetical protein